MQIQTKEIDKSSDVVIEDESALTSDINATTLEDTIVSPETVILEEGKTLRLLALELFGNKEFWVYIYHKNKDVIPNPNRVTSGLKLIIPEIDKYNIDNTNPESVAKAKLEGDAILKSR